MSDASAQSQQSWAQSYGARSYDVNGAPTTSASDGSGSDFTRGIARMPDGGFVVAGQLDLPELYLRSNGQNTGVFNSGAALVRYAADGTIIWQQLIRQDNDTAPPGGGNYSRAVSRVHTVLTDAQGNIFISGSKGTPGSAGVGAPFVAKFEASGALIWQRGISGARLDSRTEFRAALTRDGGVLLTSQHGVTDAGGANSDPALAKLNSDGSLAFYAVYDQAVQYLDTAAVCESANENNVYVAVARNGAGVTLLRIDGSGNILSVHDTRNGDVPRDVETPIAIVPTVDGGFATLSRVGRFATQGVVLRKFSQTLTPVFEKFIRRNDLPNGTEGPIFTGDGLVAEADDGFLITGSTQATESGGTLPPGSGGGREEATIMRVSAAGAIEFVSLLGGPKGEGVDNNRGTSAPRTFTHVVRAGDGGYAFTTSSYSYVGEAAPEKPDWWTAKTDANRRVRNFSGLQVELSPSRFTATDVPNTGSATPAFTRVSNGFTTVVLTTTPGFIFDDLAAKTGINKPDVIFQGGLPRIISSLTTEAVIGQHFSYRIVGGFFEAGKTLTYRSSRLPDGFVLNSQTGVISGAPKAGSETTNPFLIAVFVSDGTDSANATLSLTIGNGTPRLTVNDSDQPAFPGSGAAVTGFADRPMAFAVRYPGTLAGQAVGVEMTTTPNVPESWVYLLTRTDGYMTYDPASGRYVLNSTNYLPGSAVYFRARVKADGYPDSVSNVVGPYNLASNTDRIGQTVFRVIRNGMRADFDFRATEFSSRADAALRVQSTRTPGDEVTWTDIPDGNAGKMTQSNRDARLFGLATNNVPAGDGVFFRAVARSTGAVDSLSNIVGPYSITAATPPSITSITVSPSAGSGSTFDTPALITVDANGIANFKITARATGPRPIKTLSILFDGSTLQTVTAGSEVSLDYRTSVIGDHVIEALAVDDLGVRSRAGTKPLYLRVNPAPATAAKAERAANGDAAALAFRSEVYTVANSGGRWDDPATWRNQSGNPGVPGGTDFVILGSSTVQLGSAQSVFALSINGGRLIGPGALEVNNLLTINGGSFESFVNLKLRERAVCQMLNGNDFRFDGVFFNQGKLNVHGERGLIGLSNLLSTGSVTFQPPLLTPALVTAGLPLDPRIIAATTVDISGTVAVQSLIGLDGAGIIGDKGFGVIGQDTAGLVAPSGGSFISNNGGTFVSNNGGSFILNNGRTLIGRDGAGAISDNGAGLIGQDGAGIVAGGAGNLLGPDKQGAQQSASAQAAATGSSGFTQESGETDLSGLFISGPVTLKGGVLSGSGTIYGSLTNEAGFISPGNSPGAITVTGNYTQNSGGTLIIDAAGGEANQFDQLRVGGTAALDGKLIVNTIDGYVPLPGDPFNPLGYGSATGSFASVSSNVQLSVGATGLLATLSPNAPNPAGPKLLNIATRMRVETGDNALIAGFIVLGNAPKKVLLRAIGPSLPVDGKLADPTLELVRAADGSTTFNNNWKDSQQGEIAATTIPPSDDRESAIVATLEPGSYTAVMQGLVAGQPSGTGVGLVEVYDLDPAASSSLANISTRGLVQRGDDVMIGGLIIGGTQPAKVLIRAIGGSLSAQGVSGALQDPELELVDKNGNTISNDDWRATQEAEIIATTVPPSDSREAAIVATLVPDFYTAIVRGKGESTGIALVEAFNLQ